MRPSPTCDDDQSFGRTSDSACERIRIGFENTLLPFASSTVSATQSERSACAFAVTANTVIERASKDCLSIFPA